MDRALEIADRLRKVAEHLGLNPLVCTSDTAMFCMEQALISEREELRAQGKSGNEAWKPYNEYMNNKASQKQIDYIKVLDEKHEKGIPELHEARLLAESGSLSRQEAKRLLDKFASLGQ